jgi:membrane-bound serine protease (ClpP class)
MEERAGEMKRNLSRRIVCTAVTAALLIGFLLSSQNLPAAEKAPVFDVITISAAITPPIAEYIVQSIGEAAKSGAEGLILRLDTPGGLDLAMRDIAKGILNAPIPVIVYVAPSGARAASAGVIITVAAHVAAMAPGTNIGAAHPVGLGIGGDEPEGGKRRRCLRPGDRQQKGAE